MSSSSPKQPPKDPNEYEVGYGKPPREHQFKPKQSGNPKGRPKGARSVSETVMRHLDGNMTVRHGGRPRRMNRREVLVQKMYERALSGDNRAAAILLNYDLATRPHSPEGGGETDAFSAEQSKAIFDAFVATLKEGDEP